MNFADYLVLFIYFSGMAAIGIWAMRQVKAQEDYFMGGRKFGKLFQTFAAFGAGTGSADPVNTARGTFANGMSGMWGVMYWLFVTPIYWISAVWYRRMRCLTLGDWFTERYESKPMGVAYAIFGCFYYIVYGAMLFTAIGKVGVPLLGEELMGTKTEYVLVPLVAVIVMMYGVLGGITAAYWTDLIQGICIILLSILLIPFGLNEVVKRFGAPGDSWTDGFRVMHEQLPASTFEIVGGSAASEFPLYAIITIVIMNMIGIVLTPHFIVTGGGSAKSEHDARVGLVTGNFIKRFCTIGWVITALIVLTLYGDNQALIGDADMAWGVATRELLGPLGIGWVITALIVLTLYGDNQALIGDADMAWGVATRELLGPLGIGLVGLMLACLLAALMSSVDCYMLVCSALVVRNIYVPYGNPNATEQECLRLGRITGAIVVLGAVMVSVTMLDMFKQLELTWIVPMTFAALFWLGMYWRRATTKAGWITIVFCLLCFFVLPRAIPAVAPELRTHEAYLAVNSPEGAAGGQSIYWTGGVAENEEEGGDKIGQGSFRFDMVIYDKLLGLDLTQYRKAALKTLEFPFKIIAPFLVMIIASLLTQPNSKKALDRLYVKMKTPVDPDPEGDAREIDVSYARPDRFNDRKLFPGSNWEFERPTKMDFWGFVGCFVVCFAIIGVVLWVARIGT